MRMSVVPAIAVLLSAAFAHAKEASKDLTKASTFTDNSAGSHGRYTVVAVDVLGQEGEPSSPVWHGQSYADFYAGQWHQ